jgi:inner membrane protein
MASVISHVFFGLALGKIYASRRVPLRFWVLSAACSAFPDVDVIGFSFGIEYGDLLGHRGFTHSLLFALILGCFVGLVFFKGLENVSRWALCIYFFLVTASHGMLDAITDGGLGVAFLSLFKNTRYFFPWRPIRVSPLHIRSFFTSRGVEVMIGEIKWIWIPTLVCVIAVWLCRNCLISRRSMR